MRKDRFAKLFRRTLFLFKAYVNGMRRQNPINRAYFVWQRHRHPDLFNIETQEGSQLTEIVKAFNYSKAIVDWFVDKGDGLLRVDYPLDADSIVFDVGGYVGEWAEYIRQRFDPHIYIYEPNPECREFLRERFQNASKVLVYSYGLSDRNRTAMLNIAGIGSSIYKGGKQSQQAKIELRDIQDVIFQLNITNIDLIKINIEGGEYSLLKRMIETGIVKRCRDIQIQFHDWYPEAGALRKEITRSLSLSHYRTWNYPFVWENWRKTAP